MIRRLSAVLVLAAPLLALAQTITVTESNDQDKIVNVAECSGGVTDLLSFTWTTTTTSTTGTFDLFASDQAGCPTPTSNTTTTAHTITIQASITGSSLTNVISVSSLLGQLAITCPGAATAVNFCLFPSGSTTLAASASFQLDLQTPPAPVANAPTAGDSALNVSWSQGAGSADAGTAGAATGYNVYCEVSGVTATGTAIANKCASVTGAGTSSTRIGGLTNGTLYDVEVTALSAGGNESAHSNRQTGTPIEIDDFWRLYRNAGGRESGGCATGAAGLVALVALAPLALRRRRRRP